MDETARSRLTTCTARRCTANEQHCAGRPFLSCDRPQRDVYSYRRAGISRYYVHRLAEHRFRQPSPTSPILICLVCLIICHLILSNTPGEETSASRQQGTHRRTAAFHREAQRVGRVAPDGMLPERAHCCADPPRSKRNSSPAHGSRSCPLRAIISDVTGPAGRCMLSHLSYGVAWHNKTLIVVAVRVSTISSCVAAVLGPTNDHFLPP